MTQLPQSQFLKNVIILAGGTAMAQGILVLASPLLARLYRPDQFGVLSIYVAILSVVVMVVSLRYELAIPLSATDREARHILALALIALVGMSCLMGLGVLLFRDPLIRWVSTPSLRPFIWMLPISVAGAGAYQVFTYWAIRVKRFDVMARTKWSQSLGLIISQVGLSPFGIFGLLAGDVVGRVAGSGTLALLVVKANPGDPDKLDRRLMLSLAKRYVHFPLISSWSALINSAGQQIPTLLLASYFPAQVVGWFALSQRVIGAPMLLVGTSVSQVYLGEAARLRRENPEALPGLFLRTTLRLGWLTAVPMLSLGLVGPWLFALVFGHQWRVAGEFTQIMAVSYWVQMMVNPLSQTLNVFERQGVQFFWDSMRLLMVILSIVMPVRYGCSIHTTLWVYSVVVTLTWLLLHSIGYLILVGASKKNGYCAAGS